MARHVATVLPTWHAPQTCLITPGTSVKDNTDCETINSILWEPMEDSCRPENLQHFYDAMKYVDIFSPNSDELASLFEDHKEIKQAKPCMEELKSECSKVLTSGFGDKPGALVIRMGADGCYVATIHRGFCTPAWYSSKTIPKSFDVTGCGNAFMGGFAAGLMARDRLLETGLSEYEVAAIYGSVASSFVIEQAGMPKLTCEADGTELWNGCSVQERLEAMRRRILEDPNVEMPLPISEEEMRKQSLFEPNGISHKGEL